MSRYNIETAKSAGFCFGVKRAVEIAEKTAEENGSCYTLGELIHNGSEIARLQKLGVYPIDSPDDLPQGRTLIIRSHGVAKSVTDYIHDKGISCIDATCPFVAKIHNIVSKSECPVIIAGDPDHPEVIGIVGHCRNPDEVSVVRDSDELEKMAELQKFPRQNALIMVAQTTFNSSKWQSCVQVAKNTIQISRFLIQYVVRRLKDKRKPRSLHGARRLWSRSAEKIPATPQSWHR